MHVGLHVSVCVYILQLNGGVYHLRGRNLFPFRCLLTLTDINGPQRSPVSYREMKYITNGLSQTQLMLYADLLPLINDAM